jgi:hypothetical protein
VWRLFISFAASVLGAVLLLRGVDYEPTHLPVPLLIIQPAQAPDITLPPGPLATLSPLIEPHWDEALALAAVHPLRPRKLPTLVARASVRPELAPPTRSPISPIGQVFAWFASHAVRTAIRNDQVAGG